MVIRAFVAIGAGWALVASSGNALNAEEPLEPPIALTTCQIAYGPLGTTGTVLLAWKNAESYEAIEFSLDDQPAPGEIDGTFAAGRLQAEPGSHTFGVRGLVGERASTWTTATFTVRGESPLTHPIDQLDCELIPGNGGTLRLTWTLGPDAWVSGTLEAPGQDEVVVIPAGATTAEIHLSPSSEGSGDDNEPRVAILSFKSADGYSSPPFTPLCLARTPAFRRGDCDSNGRVNITDPIVVLNHLFRGGKRWRCDDACDANDDGKVDISDPVTTLMYLFLGHGDAVPSPGPRACGVDPTADFLGGTCECK
jgi:hypothetical protein